MIKRCEVDGQPFEAKRPSAKYCSDKCRQRAHRGVGTVTVLQPRPEGREGPLEVATKRKLEEVDRLETELGVAAMLLACRLDALSQADTGAGLAALMKEYRATLVEAVRDADDEHDALDDIRQAAALKLIRGA